MILIQIIWKTNSVAVWPLNLTNSNMIFIVYVDKRTPPHIHNWLYKMEGIKKKEQSLINISFIIIYIVYLTAGYYWILLCKKKWKERFFFTFRNQSTCMVRNIKNIYNKMVKIHYYSFKLATCITVVKLRFIGFFHSILQWNTKQI